MYTENPNIVIHLAAYAGVRTSLEQPEMYMANNIKGTHHLIDACEMLAIDKVLYASTSSVNTGPIPFKEDPPGQAKHPYAMTKIANESMFNYSRIDSTTGLRFFTVYGPWGRPDMALYKFVDNMHPADNKDTWSDTSKLQALGYKPKVSIEKGVANFVEWYKSYYKVN
jgi:UDP-glucuronate 4-epimerase